MSTLDFQVQQLALIDSLARNWDIIVRRLGPLSPALQTQLSAIGGQLLASGGADEAAVLVDQLLDLTADTAAGPFVRDLVRRAQVTGKAERSTSTAAHAPLTSAAPALQSSRHDLGRVIQSEPYLAAVPVFFATNRRAEGGSSAADCYGGEYTDTLTYGTVRVTIPLSHKMARLESPWPLFRYNEQKHVTAGDVIGMSWIEFTRTLQTPGDLLIFIHGYNMTFEDAARRAAQVTYDLRFGGAVVLFSWPSWGAALRYAADEDHARVSALILAKFLALLESGPWRRIHVMAHSMGNRLMLDALSQHATKLPIGEIIFLAADVYLEDFKQQFPKVTCGRDLVTSYATKKDVALLLSVWLHRTPRLGFFDTEPHLISGIETVDASAVDTGLFGHSYFGDVRSVLTDIGYLLGEGIPAARRKGLQPSADNRYWTFAP